MKHKLTRLTALMLALILSFSTLLVPVQAASFTDVPEKAWYRKAVEYVSDKGWMNGVGEMTFAPTMDVTRGMFVTLLAAYADVDVDNSNAAFADTGAGKWYTGAAAWAAEQEIVKGIGSGQFAPNRSISRQDLCTMLYKYLQSAGIQLKADSDRTYADFSSVSPYAREAVAFCAASGLVTGFEDSSFRPKNTATRAQVAQILMRLDQLRQGEELPEDPMPAQSFEPVEAGEMTVSVEAPQGALPEGSSMTVDPVTDEAALASIREKIAGKLYAAADISFFKDEVKIEPSAEVEVQISMDGLENLKNPAVVHVRPDGSVEYVEAELVSANRSGDQKALRFRASRFSVYAVIGDGESSSLKTVTVNFYVRKNGASGPSANAGDWEIVNRQILRKTQIEKAETPFIDPGVPNLSANQSFEGWFYGSGSFTESDTGESVAEINVHAKQDLPTANATWNFYAMVYNVVYVVFHDQAGAVLRTTPYHVAEGTSYANAMINMTYAPFKDNQNFTGWVTRKDVLTLGDYPTYKENPDPVIRNNTEYQVSETLELYPYVQEGYWLIYDANISNNDSDPTKCEYKGPDFIPEGTLTAEPVFKSSTPRKGYELEGWYTDPAMRNRYTFGQALTKDTTLYAKWTPAQTTYRVVYWTQKRTDNVGIAEDKKSWDYYVPTATGVVTSGTATSGSTVTLTSSSTGKTAYNRLGRNTTSNHYTNRAQNGELGYYYRLNTNLTETSKQVKGDGSTVLNVYYDRAAITISFYTTDTYSSTYLINSYTGLYQHDFPNSNYPTISSSYCWKYLDTNNNTTYIVSNGTRPNTFLNWIDCSDTWNIYRDTATSWTYSSPVYYRTEGTDGVYTLFRQDTLEYNSSSSAVTQYLGGYEYYGFTGIGWNKTGNSMTNSGYTPFTATTDAAGAISFDGYEIRNYGANIYYSRNKWNFVYNSNNSAVKTETGVYYQEDISSFANYVPTNGEEGYYFDGWYANPDFDKPYDFSQPMPNNDVAVYAKWTQKRYRVILDYTGGDEEAVVTFPGGTQDSTWRSDYGETIQESAIVAARREGYLLLGWYTDPEFKKPFNFNMLMNDGIADMSYGTRGADETLEAYQTRMNSASRKGHDDVANKDWDDTWVPNWRELDFSDYAAHGFESEEDYRNDYEKKRVRVRGKITLYAKWRQDPEGTIGVNVTYLGDHSETDTGYFNTDGQPHIWKDPELYVDRADAYAQAASVPENANEHFLYWEILDEDGNPTGRVAYPGQTWQVRLEDAAEVRIPVPNPNCAHDGGSTHVEAKDPTCTEKGNVEYWSCNLCGKYFSDEELTTVISDPSIAALGHSWGTPSYTWNPASNLPVNGTVTCTGTATCTRDSSHTCTETVTAAWIVDTAATTSATGTAHYEATFTNTDAFTKQSSVSVTIPKITGYTVTFSVPNGVTAPADQIVASNANADLSVTPTGTIDGYTFLGWVAETVDNSTTAVTPLESYTVTADTTLYALYSHTESSGTVFELLTSAPSDWTGNYVITNNNTTTKYVLKGVTGSANGTDAESSSNCSTLADSGITMENNRLTNVSNDYIMVLAASGSYYSVQSLSTSAYYGMNSSSYLYAYSTLNTTYCRWTPAINTSGAAQLLNSANGSTPYFGFSTSNNYFWSASSSNANVLQLWKETQSSTTTWTTEISTYTVNFTVPNGITAPAQQTAISGSSITLPTADAPSGYTFAGWVTDDVTETTTAPSYLTGSYPVTADVTLKALYTRSVTTGGTYTRLTSAPSSWAGNYVITYLNTTSLYAMKGLANEQWWEGLQYGGSTPYAATGMTLSGNTLSNVSENYVFKMEANGSYYTIKNLATDAYVSKYDYPNYGAELYSITTDFSGYSTWINWTPTYNSSGYVTLTNNASVTGTDYPTIGFDSSRGYFWMGNAEGHNINSIYLWKETTAPGTTNYYTTSPAAQTGYTVSFSVPSGVAAVNSLTAPAGGSVVLPAAAAPSGSYFVGWATSAANTTTQDPTSYTSYLASGALYQPTGNVTLNAVYYYEDTYYALQTSMPSSLGGYYVISSGTTSSAYMMLNCNGANTSMQSTTYRTQISASGATISTLNGATIMRDVPNANRFLVSGVTSSGTQIGYSIRNNSGYYLIVNSSNQLSTYTTALDDYSEIWNLSYQSAGTFTIRNYYSTSYYLRWSATSGTSFSGYFTASTTSSGNVYLWMRTTDYHYTSNPAAISAVPGEVEVMNRDGELVERVLPVTETQQLPEEPVVADNPDAVMEPEEPEADEQPTRGIDVPKPVTEDTVSYQLASSVEVGKTYLIVYGNAATAASSTTMRAMNSYSTSSGSGYLVAATPDFSDSTHSVITGVTTNKGTIADCEWTVGEGTMNTDGVYTFYCAADGSNYYLYESSSSDGNLSATKSPSNTSYANWAVRRVNTTDPYVYLTNYYWDSQSSTYFYFLRYSSSGFSNYYESSAIDSARMYLYEKVENTTPKYTLTIHYQYADGSQAYEDYEAQYEARSDYSVTSPEITGYTANYPIVSGTMPESDHSVTVTYSPKVVSNEKWEEVTTIIPNEDYLIGLELNGTVYLLLNYSNVYGQTYHSHETTSSGNTVTANEAYLGVAAIDGEGCVTGVSGAANDLQYAHWVFSDASGGTVTSGYDSTRALYWNYGFAFPNTSGDTWTWNASAHTLINTYNSTAYGIYARQYDGAYYCGISSTASTYQATTVRLYKKVVEEGESTWTVSFVDEDGVSMAEEGYASYNVTDGDTVTRPADPEREDYYFLGWYYVNSEGQEVAYNFGDEVHGDLTLIAHFLYAWEVQYTITLRAVYGIPNTTGRTFIYWYANDGTDYGHGVGAGDRFEMLEMDQNVAYNIPTPNGAVPTVGSPANMGWTGGSQYYHDAQGNATVSFQQNDMTHQDTLGSPERVFLGWARIPVPSGESGTVGTAHPELTEDDLYLKWTGEKYQYKNDEGEWEDLKTGAVGQVYAIDDASYHDMYAVWASYAYIFHSATGEMEAVEVKRGVNVDLVSKVPEHNLYGGYYTEYGGVKGIVSDADLNTAKSLAAQNCYSADHAGGSAAAKLVAVNGAVTYNGESIKNANNARFWTKAKAYGYGAQADAPSGDKLTPTVGTVYYVKEVPETYLTTKYLYTYNISSGVIENFFMVTATDDTYYSNVGFRCDYGEEADAESTAKVRDIIWKDALVSTFSVVQGGDEPVPVNVTAADFGLKRGYVGVKNQDSLASANNVFTVMPVWQTLDGVEVNSRGALKLTVNAAKTAISYELLGTVSTPYTSIYVNVNPVKNDWLSDGAVTRLYFFGDSDPVWVETTAVTGKEGYFKAEIPEGSWTGYIVVRCAKDSTSDQGWDAKLNQTSNIAFQPRVSNLVTITGTNGYGADYNYTTGVYNPN